jgi:hypothetical protein
MSFPDIKKYDEIDKNALSVDLYKSAVIIADQTRYYAEMASRYPEAKIWTVQGEQCADFSLKLLKLAEKISK